MFDFGRNLQFMTLLGAGTFASILMFATQGQAEPAPEQPQPEREVAYCNTEDFAIKIYQLEGLDSANESSRDAFIRIYDRNDQATFINRTPVSRQTVVKNDISGIAYENLRGENQWELFVTANPGEGFDPESPNADPNAGVHQCILSRDGEVMAYGEGRISHSVGGSGGYEGTPGESGSSSGSSERPSSN
jgi:hypothetical protein